MDSRICDQHSTVEEITFTHKKIQTVWKGRCINHTNEYTDYNGMDKTTGELYVIKEISFDSKTNDVEDAKDHLSRLVALEHCYLFEIKNFVHVQTSTNKEVFYILQTFDFGYTNISLFLTENIVLANKYLKTLTESLLEVMKYLEEQNIQRANILHSSVYVNNNGDIKLYDYGLEALISNYVCVNNVNTSNSTFAFAVLLISLLQGKVIDANDIQNMPSDCQLLLNNLYTKHQSTEELMQNLLLELDTSIEFMEQINYPAQIEYTRNTSKVENNVEIIEELGKGAYGKVYKVKDKTDHKHYALKKIKLSANNDKRNNSIQREVMHLSELEHKHIVRYYNSWKEYEDASTSESEDDEFDFSSNSMYLENSHSRIEAYSNEDLNESDDSNRIANEITNATFQNTLYIKMELCEGNTLAYVINQNKLFENSNLIWTYFKQILKGLQHIHDKKIIHRDLKPSNIFLDSNNQIKIGDFGFATNKLRYTTIEEENLKNSKTSVTDSYTSRKGTIYYKAPELNSSQSVVCDYKLDMYSLGIILFEMCYQPFYTLSERAKVLLELRNIQIIFPVDFNNDELINQRKIIRQLLNHDAKQRPNCQELMQSDLIPHLPEEKSEEKQLQVIQRIAKNPQSKFVSEFVNCCFKRENNRSFLPSIHFDNKTYAEATMRIITDIFRKHGGQNYDLSVASLKDVCYNNCGKCTKALSSTGKVVVVPCDSRIFFLRYAILHNYSWIKRYTIQKSNNFGESEYVCAFDTITPVDLTKHKCYISDAEVLLMLSELANSFPNLVSNNFILNISHCSLREAILEECNLSSDSKNNSVLTFPYEFVIAYQDKLKLAFKNYDFNKHIRILEKCKQLKNLETPDLITEFQNPSAYSKAEQAIIELSNIIAVAKEIGVQCNMVLKHTFTSLNYYSGMVFELSYTYQNAAQTTIALGGRYDKFFQEISIPSLLHSIPYFKRLPCKLYGVGVSIYPEKLNYILKTKQSLNLSEVIVCASSYNVLPEIHRVLKIFWRNNISCNFIKMATMKHCYKYCSKNKLVWIFKVKQQLLRENKVQIIYRKNGLQKCQKWTIGFDYLVLATKTLLNLEPLDQINLEANTEVPILFRTTAKLSFFDKVKCKCELAKELHTRVRQFSTQRFLTFIINFDSNLVQEFVNNTPKDPRKKNVLRCIYEDISDKDVDEKGLIVLFANASLSSENVNICFSYYTYNNNQLIFLS